MGHPAGVRLSESGPDRSPAEGPAQGAEPAAAGGTANASAAQDETLPTDVRPADDTLPDDGAGRASTVSARSGPAAGLVLRSALPGETVRQRADRIYAAAETTLDSYYAKRRRRGPPILLATVLVLTLAVAIVVAIDLRRLQTPSGAALGWSGAALFGGCENYDRLSLPGPGDPPDRRSDRDRCLALTAATDRNRQQAGEISLSAGRVVQRGQAATVELTLTRPGRGKVLVSLLLRRSGDGWAVLRTAAACAAVGCV